MNINIKMFAIILMIAIISCGISGCIDLGSSDSTGTNTNTIDQSGSSSGSSSSSSSSGSSSKARDCPNCGHYPQYKGKMCVVCGYGDNDGILYCPYCDRYTFHGTSWQDGYCTSCGYYT
jgi:hypothetical protein